jgi:hypothetical protein
MCKVFKFPTGEVIDKIEQTSLKDIFNKIQAIESEMRERGFNNTADHLHKANNSITAVIMEEDLAQRKRERA